MLFATVSVTVKKGGSGDELRGATLADVPTGAKEKLQEICKDYQSRLVPESYVEILQWAAKHTNDRAIVILVRLFNRYLTQDVTVNFEFN